MTDLDKIGWESICVNQDCEMTNPPYPHTHDLDKKNLGSDYEMEFEMLHQFVDDNYHETDQVCDGTQKYKCTYFYASFGGQSGVKAVYRCDKCNFDCYLVGEVYI